jgi:hypothetical protein
MNRVIVFGIAFAVGLVGQASAGTFYRYVSPATGSAKTVAGIVSSSGQIERGSGFTVQHVATGEYQIAFGPQFFPTGCAVMLVQTWGRSPSTHEPVIVGTAHTTNCDDRDPVFHVHLRATDNIMRDDRFQFIVVGV